MDAVRFDRLTKVVHSRAHRRGVLAGLVAIPLTLGARGQGDAKDKVKPCKEHETLCGHVCADLQKGKPFFCGSCLTACGFPAKCVNGECV